MTLDVMVIDDSSVQRMHAVRLCQELGWNVVAEGDDGLNALLQLRTRTVQPQLILLDLEMPGINGVALLKELAGLQLSVALMIVSSREQTLLDSVAVLGRTMGLNIIGVVQKPLKKEPLQHAYEACLLHDNALQQTTQQVLSVILSEALAQDQLQFMYQARIEMRSRIIHSLRLIPCWQGGEHPPEILSPYDSDSPKWLKRLAEQIQLSLSHLAAWQMRGLRLALNIPVPVSLLAKSWFAETISVSLNALQISPAALILEVNRWEGDDAASIINSLSLLRLHGVGLAFADQGNGFAWLEEQGLMPFNEYHIPADLLVRAQQREISRHLLRGYFAMAREFQLKTLVASVRSRADWDVLLSLDCDFVAGNWIAPPLSAEEVPQWIKSHAEAIRSL